MSLPDFPLSYLPLPSHTPLSDNLNALEKAIVEGPIEHDVPDDCYRKGRLVTKIIALGISALAKVPYIPISLELPGGPLFAAGNSLAFLNLEYWAIRGTIDDFLGPRTLHERQFVNFKDQGGWGRVVVVVTAVGIGVLSQVPSALPALDYDPEYKVPGFFVVLVSGSLLPIRSLQLSFEKSLQMYRAHRAVEDLRKEMLSLIARFQGLFIRAKNKKKKEIVSKMQELCNTPDSNFKVHAYASHIFNEAMSSPEPSSSWTDRIAAGLGTILVVSFQTAFALYTWDKSQEHFKSDLAAGFFSSTGVLSGIYLIGKATVGTAQRVARAAMNFFCCRREQTFAEQLHSRLAFTLKTLGILIDLLALGPSVEIWGDFRQDGDPFLHRYFQINVCTTIFLLLSTATFDSIDHFIELWVAKFGSEEKKQLIVLHQDLQLFSRLIEQSPSPLLVEFVNHSQKNVREYLYSKTSASIEQISTLIDD